MKKNLIQRIGLLSFVAATVILMSCTMPALTGQTVKESRDHSGFSGVVLAFSGNIYVTQGKEFKVELEADKDVMDILVTEMNGNTLVFKTKNNVWRNLGQVKAYVTLPEIEKLSVSGSGDMVCESPVKADELELSVSGSGSLRVSSLAAREVSAEVTGSGDIVINGQTADNSELDARITGSGDIRADGFAVQEATVQITGSGSATVNAVKELETNITGSGSVNYKGNPLVNANATGSGRTRSIN